MSAVTQMPTHNARKREKVSDATGPLKKKHPFYDYGPLLSHNAAYNFLVGGRGLGKTYGAKKRAIKRFLEHGEMWIYVRRYKDELVPARETLFADIAHEFPDWDFRILGNTLEVSEGTDRTERKRKWRTMGYIMALSVAQQYKSVAYPLVTTIIFDEFIIEKGAIQYLPNEAQVFNNLYSTVDRWQDKTTAFFLANAVSLANPYFIEYEILPDPTTEWVKDKKTNFYVAHFPQDAAFAESVLNTRFGRFIQDTDYAKYAVGNEFVDGHAKLVGIKNPKARYRFTLETRMGSFSIWEDSMRAEWYATKKHPGNRLNYTLLPDRMTEDKTLLMWNNDLIARLRYAFSSGQIFFDGPITRNMFLDLFKRQ